MRTGSGYPGRQKLHALAVRVERTPVNPYCRVPCHTTGNEVAETDSAKFLIGSRGHAPPLRRRAVLSGSTTHRPTSQWKSNHHRVRGYSRGGLVRKHKSASWPAGTAGT